MSWLRRGTWRCNLRRKTALDLMPYDEILHPVSHRFGYSMKLYPTDYNHGRSVCLLFQQVGNSQLAWRKVTSK